MHKDLARDAKQTPALRPPASTTRVLPGLRLPSGIPRVETLDGLWFSRQMAYFRDLSPYEYGLRLGGVPGAQNVGWLSLGHPFKIEQPLERDVDALWTHCKVSIHATRGLHRCEFCLNWTDDRFRVSRNGESLLLGYSEIRVIGASGQSYAAPSLIYHYVSVHHYRPPDSFLSALRSEPKPPSKEYFEALQTRQLTWDSTIR